MSRRAKPFPRREPVGDQPPTSSTANGESGLSPKAPGSPAADQGPPAPEPKTPEPEPDHRSLLDKFACWFDTGVWE